MPKTMNAAPRLLRPAAHTNISIPFELPVVQLVPIKNLKEADYNPKDRSDPKSTQKVLQLASAIQATRTCGIIWIRPDLTIIEGHRTVAALKVLDASHAPCVTYEGDPHQLYALINANQKPLSSRHKLVNYLAQMTSVTPYMQVAFARMERIVGRVAMEQVCQKGGSLATFKQAIAIAEYCGEEDDRFVKKALLWLVNLRMTRLARQFMDARKPATRLLAAIAGNTKLCC